MFHKSVSKYITFWKRNEQMNEHCRVITYRKKGRNWFERNKERRICCCGCCVRVNGWMEDKSEFEGCFDASNAAFELRPNSLQRRRGRTRIWLSGLHGLARAYCRAIRSGIQRVDRATPHVAWRRFPFQNCCPGICKNNLSISKSKPLYVDKMKHEIFQVLELLLKFIIINFHQGIKDYFELRGRV